MPDALATNKPLAPVTITLPAEVPISARDTWPVPVVFALPAEVNVLPIAYMIGEAEVPAITFQLTCVVLPIDVMVYCLPADKATSLMEINATRILPSLLSLPWTCEEGVNACGHNASLVVVLDNVAHVCL